MDDKSYEAGYANGFRHGCAADLRRWAVEEARAALQINGTAPLAKAVTAYAASLLDFAANEKQPKKKAGLSHRSKRRG